jgi:hypothetical protein
LDVFGGRFSNTRLASRCGFRFSAAISQSTLVDIVPTD